MRSKVLDFDELSDSKELMIERIPPLGLIFMTLVALLIAIGITWAIFAKIDTYVVASGEIRSILPSSTITTLSSGKISKVNVENGAHVEKGDVLMEFEESYFHKQEEDLNSQITKKEVDITNYHLLIDSIKSDLNKFSAEDSPIFYYQYEAYRLELDGSLLSVSATNSQTSATSMGYDTLINSLNKNSSEIRAQEADYKSLYDAVNSDSEYKGTNAAMHTIYNSYKAEYEKARLKYVQFEQAYKNLIDSNSVSDVTEFQLLQAKSVRDEAYLDMLSVKENFLQQITSSISSLSQENASQLSSITDYQVKKSSLVYDTSSDIITKQLKNKYYSNISGNIESLEQEIKSLESQILEIEESIKNSEVVAACDGYLVYSQDFTQGDVVSGGNAIASIVPSDEGCKTVLYIPESNITAIQVGQDVKYSFDSVSETDFGNAHGRITEISADSFVDQNTNQKFYKTIASIDDVTLTGKEGETRTLRIGMLTNAHAITGTQSVMSWLLDKLNFI